MPRVTPNVLLRVIVTVVVGIVVTDAEIGPGRSSIGAHLKL